MRLKANRISSPQLAPIHNRMPVILKPSAYARWLGERPASNEELQAMLKPYPADAMEAFKIGPRIGNVKNDEPSLVEPIEPQNG